MTQTWNPFTPGGPCSPLSPATPFRGGIHSYEFIKSFKLRTKCWSIFSVVREMVKLTDGPGGPAGPTSPSFPGGPWTHKDKPLHYMFKNHPLPQWCRKSKACTHFEFFFLLRSKTPYSLTYLLFDLALLQILVHQFFLDHPFRAKLFLNESRF